MPRSLSPVSRRRFLQSSALGAVALAAPAVLRAQGTAINPPRVTRRSKAWSTRAR
jgi:hypothetical protein